MKLLIHIVFAFLIIFTSVRLWYLINDKVSKEYEFKIDGGNYDQNINVIITQDTSYAIKYINRVLDTNINSSDLVARGVTYPSVNGKPIVIWLDNADDISIVNHELFHVTMSIMNWANIPLTEDTEEAYAYELQYLTKKFNDKTK